MARGGEQPFLHMKYGPLLRIIKIAQEKKTFVPLINGSHQKEEYWISLLKSNLHMAYCIQTVVVESFGKIQNKQNFLHNIWVFDVASWDAGVKAEGISDFNPCLDNFMVIDYHAYLWNVTRNQVVRHKIGERRRENRFKIHISGRRWVGD